MLETDWSTAENKFQRDQLQDVMYKASTIYPGFALNPWQNWIKVTHDVFLPFSPRLTRFRFDAMIQG